MHPPLKGSIEIEILKAWNGRPEWFPEKQVLNQFIKTKYNEKTLQKSASVHSPCFNNLMKVKRWISSLQNFHLYHILLMGNEELVPSVWLALKHSYRCIITYHVCIYKKWGNIQVHKYFPTTSSSLTICRTFTWRTNYKSYTLQCSPCC